MSGPLILAVESSCDETGRRAGRGRAADPRQRGRQPDRPACADRRHRARGRGARPPALDRAGARRGARDRRASACPTSTPWPSPTGRGSPGSLLVGINVAKSLAWAHDKPLVPVNHLEGHVYAGWLLDPGEAEREAPPFPLVALVVSGGHTFLVEMRDHLDYRLLGQTVDDAAGEAFDKVGRLLGLGYPGGPAISRAAEGAKAKDRVFPRAWLGGSYDLSFSGLKTAARRIVTAARADEGLPADEREGSLPEPVVAELAWGFQDSVVDVLATKTIRAAEEVGARGIVLGGGVAANAALRQRIAGEAEARGHPAGRPATRPVHGQRGDDRGGRGTPAGGRRAGRARPRRPAVAAARAMSPADLRLDPAYVRRTLRDAGLRPRHRHGPELPRRRRRPRGDPARGGSRARRAGARDRPGARVPDRRPAGRGRHGDGRRARSGDGRVPARHLRRRGGRRRPPAHRGRRAGPGPRRAGRAAVRRRREPPVPDHEPRPAPAARPRRPARTGWS